MEIHFQITDHVVAVEKVAEHHIGTKLCSCNNLKLSANSQVYVVGVEEVNNVYA